MSVLRWETPPPVMRHRWSAIVLELEARPGQWAVVAENLSYSETESARSALARYKLQVSIRKQRHHGWTIYARALGSSQLTLVQAPPEAMAH